MSDSSHLTEIDDATFDAAKARWSADPDLGAALMDPARPFIVLDTQAGTILQASDAAAELRSAIADRAGRVFPVLRLGDQIGIIMRQANGSRLTRLRLDTRGLARPVACRVAHAEIAPGRLVILLVPLEPIPALRAADASKRTEVSPPAAPEPAIAQAPPADPYERFVWRSDARDHLTQVTGTNADLAAALSDKSWQALARDGVVVGDAVLRALSDRRTFRALPLLVRPPQSGGEFELEMSGAPSARPNQDFIGFGGFGLIRKRTERRRFVPSKLPAEPVTRAPAHIADVAPPQREDEPARPSPTPPAKPFGMSWSSVVTSVTFPSFETAIGTKQPELPEPPEPKVDAPVTSVQDKPAAASELALSVNENAAFREIARALGARFAGDDEEATPAVELPEGTAPEQRGEVTPFPSPVSQQAIAAAVETALVDVLDRLPAGVVLHRDSAVLFANRRMLDLTGCRDSEILRAVAGPLTRPRATTDIPAVRDEIVSVATPQGTLVRLVVERTDIDWQGQPAGLLMARLAPKADTSSTKPPQTVTQVPNPASARDPLSLLDHVEDGVATIDNSGRILSLNRSAKTLLSESARDLVGGFLDEFFLQEHRGLISASLREASETGRSTPRNLQAKHGPHTYLRLRIIRLTAAGGSHFCATLRETSVTANPAAENPAQAVRGKEIPAVDFLSKIDEEVRSPLDGILASVDIMLAEQFGQLGSERYREYLREIQDSGEHVLTVVDDLVTLAKVEAGRTEMKQSPVPLNAVIAACIAQMQPQAARSRVLLRTSLSPELRTLFADESAMRQATLRIIENALRLTGAGGQVIVSTSMSERGEIAIRVRDTGAGMSQEELDRALHPFDRKSTTGSGGKCEAGLGLTLTKALVEANRGQFYIKSRKKEGTLVELVFPAAQAMSA